MNHGTLKSVLLMLVVTWLAAIAPGQAQTFTWTPLAGPAGPGYTDAKGGAAQFEYPYAVAVDSLGNVYVADTDNTAIRQVTPAGVVTTVMSSSSGLSYPTCVAVDSADNLYVADADYNVIYKMTPAGAVTILAGSGGQFGFIYGLAVDRLGNVYAADLGSSVIWRVTPGGTVTLWAGAPYGSGYRNGAAGSALFNSPEGVAVDSQFNVYVADTGNNAIRVISPTGTVSTLAGGTATMTNAAGSANGPGATAQFSYPTSVAVDSTGNVYVADSYNSTIRKVTSAGQVSTLAGNPLLSGSADGPGSTALFAYPSGVAVDSTGNVYVADSYNSTIRKVTLPADIVTTLAGSASAYGSTNGTGTAALFSSPYGIAVDGNANVYVADSGNNLIRVVSPSGVVSNLVGSQGSALTYPEGVAVDSLGNVYVADTGDNRILKVTPAGVATTVVSDTAGLSQPTGVAVDKLFNVYVADTGNNVIRKATPSGPTWVLTTLAGTLLGVGYENGAGNTALFNAPQGVAVDSNLNVYVADTGNNAIRMVSPVGVVSTLAGGSATTTNLAGMANGPGISAQFSYPTGVAVDSAGNVYVADNYNNEIRLVTPAGQVSVLAGDSSAYGGTAYGPGSAVQFENPSGVAVDAAGNVYVADDGNGRISKGATSNGPTAPGIVLSGRLAFGTLLTSKTGTASLTITNPGNATLTVTSITYPSGFSGAFSGNILAGSSHAVTITFAPTTATNYGGTITVNSDATSGIGTINTSGTGAAAPTEIISVSGSLAFGSVQLGTTASNTLTIVNNGNTPLIVTSIAYPSGELSGTWTAGMIPAGGTQSVVVIFAPTALGTFNGNLAITSNASSGSGSINASGTGIPAVTKIIGLLGSLAFGNVASGETATASLTIANTGNAALNVTSITYPSGFSGAFSGSIPAGMAQSVTITFAPTAATAYSGTVTINSDATSGTGTINASGTGIVVVEKIIGLSGNLAFGTVQTSQTAMATLTIANTGNAPLNVTSITYPSGFSGAFSGSVVGGSSQLVTVTFAPAAVTNYGGTITANSDATSGTGTIHASGSGIPVVTKIIGVSGTLAFGGVQTGQTTTATLTIANTGNAPLNVTGISYPAGFSGTFSGSIASGGSQSVTVTFTPTEATSYGGTITISSDATSGTGTIIASGTGIANLSSLTVTKFLATANFAKSSSDACTLTATFNLGTNFVATGQLLTVNVGGAQVAFASLSKAGAGASGKSTCHLTYVKKTAVWTLVIALKNGSWATDWGFSDTTIKTPGNIGTLPVEVVVAGQTFAGASPALLYTATAGKIGTAK